MRRWSRDGQNLRAYRLLVSHEHVPRWTDVAIASAGAVRDLYTSFADGAEIDRFEEWITREVDDPAAKVVERVVSGVKLVDADFRILAKFFAALDVRTPRGLIEHFRRAEVAVQQVFEAELPRLEAELGKASRSARYPPAPKVDATDFLPPLDVRLEESAEGPNGYARVEYTIGRSSWLYEMHRAIGELSAVLEKHDWCILEPHGSWTWSISDHPALKLRFHSEDNYDFGGRWDDKGVELMVPLSPRHLLFAQVGDARQASRTAASEYETVMIQEFLAKGAHRVVYALEDRQHITWYRPRHVDEGAFAAERNTWSRFHEEQRAAEATDTARWSQPTNHGRAN